jgi:hypothetical protein
MTVPVGHPRCRLLYCEFSSFFLRIVSLAHFVVTPEKLCGTDFSKHLNVVYEQRELNRLVVDEVRMSKVVNPFHQARRHIAFLSGEMISALNIGA